MPLPTLPWGFCFWTHTLRNALSYCPILSSSQFSPSHLLESLQIQEPICSAQLLASPLVSSPLGREAELFKVPFAPPGNELLRSCCQVKRAQHVERVWIVEVCLL